MSEHSFLSPSAAHRFMCCPVAPIYEATYPDKTTPAAQEGTNAHKWAELVLQGLVSIEDIPLEYVLIKSYIKYVRAIMANKNNHVYLEHLVKIDCIRGHGTIDTLAIKPAIHEVEIVDLKYGRIPVDINNNHQLLLYAIGYLSRGLYPLIGIKTVRTTICQPKLDTISTMLYPVDAVLQLRQMYKEQADKIYKMQETKTNIQEHQVGEHCTWCRHKNSCSAYKDQEFLYHTQMFS